MAAPVFSSHAEERLRQRGYRERDVRLVLECGTPTPDAVLLTGKDVAREVAECRRRIARLEKLRGTAVFLAEETVVTIYRPDRERTKRLLGHRPRLRRCRPRRHTRRGAALTLLVALLALLPLAAPSATAQTRSYTDTRSGQHTSFSGPEVAGTQTGVRSDGTLVQRQRDAAGGETWRALDGSGEQWLLPDATHTGSRTALDPQTGELRFLQEQ